MVTEPAVREPVAHSDICVASRGCLRRTTWRSKGVSAAMNTLNRISCKRVSSAGAFLGRPFGGDRTRAYGAIFATLGKRAKRTQLDLSLRARAAFVIAATMAAGGIAALQSTALQAQAPVPAPAPAPAPAQAPQAWRVECTGNGKVLECRAVFQVVQRDERQQLIPLVTLAAHYAPDTKATMLQIQLPLGLNLAEPISLRVDNGEIERQQIQTCNAAGCFVTMTLNDKFVAAMRNGMTLKITVQDASKKPTELPLPLLGFGFAYDKAK
jgi:invasion protein IalB